MPPPLRFSSRARDLIALGASVVLTAPLAAQDLAPTGPWRVERTRVADTTIVRTLSGSVWGGAPRLIEERRIGSVDGPPEYSLGTIMCVLPLPGGGVALFDNMVPALRIYDAAGKYLKTLGRRGAGPGEYQNICTGLLVDAAGVITMHDPGNARVNRYAPDGSPLPSFRTSTTFFQRPSLMVDPAGQLRAKVVVRRAAEGREVRQGWVRLVPEGARTDTIPFPEVAGRENESAKFGPRKVHAWSPLGYFVAGFSDRYALTLFKRPGEVLRIERNAPGARVGAREREQVMARLQESYRLDPHHPPPEIIDPKAPFQQISVGADGRIWVLLQTPSRWGRLPSTPLPAPIPVPLRPTEGWIEDHAYDVFEPDGTYLGQVQLPPLTWLAAATGETIWLIELGEFDEPYLVRYRLRTP